MKYKLFLVLIIALQLTGCAWLRGAASDDDVDPVTGEPTKTRGDVAAEVFEGVAGSGALPGPIGLALLAIGRILTTTTGAGRKTGGSVT